MADITTILGGEFKPPKNDRVLVDPPEIQLRDEILTMFDNAPDRIIFDGQIHRFRSSSKKLGRSGWYVAHGGNIHAAVYGDWRDGSTINWRENIGRSLTPAEHIEHVHNQRKIMDEAKKAKEEKQESAAESAATIWANATEASSDHPYLKTKQVSAHYLRVTGDGRLIVPMFNSDGLASLQFISNDGSKKMFSGGKADGSYFLLGAQTDETVFIAEGYATAATIYEQTGKPCYVAFNAGNLSAVAKVAREHHQGDLCIVADNDESNTGRTKSDDAAALVRARVVMPPIVGMDANDYFLDGGDLKALLQRPIRKTYLIGADEFAARRIPIRWMIKNQLQEDALIMVHGPSGGGKTFVVLDMVLSVASGRSEWFGNKVKQGAVVYLAGEGHAGLAGRISAWKQYNEVGELEMWLSESGTDLNTPEGEILVCDAVDSLPRNPSIIVVDTLHRFLKGDENSAQDAKTMLDACARLQQRYKCSVLLVHHTGVSDEAQHRARGSSAWRGALDIEISVVPAKDDRPLEIVQRKSKDAEMSAPVYAKLESVYINDWFDEDGEQVSSAVLKIADKPANNKTGNNELNKFIDLFNQAWDNTSKEYLFDCKFIRSSPLKEWLLEHGHFKSEGSAKNQVKPSYTNGMMPKLAEAGLARHEAGGWILIQSANEAADNLLK